MRQAVEDGRNVIYENALNGIAQHPILGNGIGQFDYNYGTYPHNLLLQLLYEGGIIFVILIFVPILILIILVLCKGKGKFENTYLVIFLVSSSIVKLMLSYEFWSDIYFWIILYLSYMVLFKEIETGRKKDGKRNNTNL